MPYDSDTTAVSDQADTELADAYDGADRFTERYQFPLRVAAAYAVTITAGYVVHVVFEGQLAQTFAALLVYFTLLFAAVSAVVFALLAVRGALRST